ncbi:hypothetical protein DAPPUDRAFT_238142 [Daphnia pulex]|uniref:Uncharacterized protein n=1 Tax=Daphnia pulex TaxID=6669 RepID=E9G6R5_DAPPU|nr:hypothetical protein DAPPUDRAFT_238142 [Daphnia pulex]|eukprot:EFX85146.1 hypothetical protein DAPPUDRAFT_238142 [Daphnia pulex]
MEQEGSQDSVKSTIIQVSDYPRLSAITAKSTPSTSIPIKGRMPGSDDDAPDAADAAGSSSSSSPWSNQV